MAEAEDWVEMPALGRPFRLGMLYDAHRDALLPEHLLFDPEACRKNTEQLDQKSEETMQVSCDTLGEKAAALGVKPALMTSLLCGLFEAKGAAGYLLSSQQSRRPGSIITWKSLALERFEKLNLTPLSSESIFAQNVRDLRATHVVTGVWYGSQAFWDYGNAAAASSDHRDEEAAPKEKKATFLPEGQAPLSRDDKEEKPQTISDPGTHRDPMKIHPSLSNLLGKGEEKGVPIKIHLYPLSSLLPTESLRPRASSFHEMSDALNSGIKDAIAGLAELEADCVALLATPTARRFREVERKILNFREKCSRSKQGVRKQLAEIVPSVRAGEKEEKELQEVLEQTEASTHRLRGSFHQKKQEVGLVDSVLSSLEEPNGAGLTTLPETRPSATADFVVAFTFTSLHAEDPGSPGQKRCFSSRKPLSEAEAPHARAWFEDEAVIQRVRETARSFSVFARANSSSQRTQFVVDAVPDEGNPGATLYLYKGGFLAEATFEPPAKPLPLRVEEVSRDQVKLRLRPPSSGKAAICSYQVEYRNVEEGKWVPSTIQTGEETATIRGLEPGTEYEFRYAWESEPGLSESSDVTGPVRTLPEASSLRWPPKETPAGSPGLWLGGHGSGTEERQAADCTKGSAREGGGGGSGSPPASAQRGGEKDGAPPPCSPPSGTKGGAVCGPGPKGVSRDIADSLCKASRVLRRGPPCVYALPLEKAAGPPKTPWKKYRFGKLEGPPPPQGQPRAIVLLGETGAGKSTLIDAIVNHLLGVQWADSFRFSLARQEPGRRSPAESGTDAVTAYEVHLGEGEGAGPCSLTLIDTPGFGDTRGRERDQLLLESLRGFLSSPDGVRHIDAVCVVVQASQARLTPLQKYIFDQVASVFGRGFQDNTQILATFADGQTPPVAEALRAGEVPCARDDSGSPALFPFNNSALFASNLPAGGDDGDDSYRFNRMFWQMGASSMETFFRSLKDLQPQRLALSADVLKEPDVKGVRHGVHMALVRLRRLRKRCGILEERWSDLKARRDFVYEVESIMFQERPIRDPKHWAVSCRYCRYTCQYVSRPQNHSGTWAPPATDTAHCNVCPGQCAWEAHIVAGFQWECQIVKEKQSYLELKRSYQNLHGKAMTDSDVCQLVSREADQAGKELLGLIERFSGRLQKLHRSAPKGSRRSLSEGIDLLIGSEEKEGQLGFEERVALLRGLREKIEFNYPRP